jgi:hypothetical protein
MPDVVKAIVGQTGGLVEEGDFYPLPCAHPNCHMMCYLYRGGGRPVPISRLIDVKKHLHLIANSVVYTPERARLLVSQYLEEAGGCGCGPNGCGTAAPSRSGEPSRTGSAPGATRSRTGDSSGQGPTRSVTTSATEVASGAARHDAGAARLAAPTGLDEFIVKALAETLNGAEVFRITLTAFLDAHTFDTRRVMKCCLAHLLPTGHVVPFCAYNTLYRDGHVPLPPLADSTRRPLALVTG